MFRWIRVAVAAGALAAALAVPARAATWTAVSGLIPGTVTSASLDGPRVLVASLTKRRSVELTTIARSRVARRQTLTTAGRAGTVRYLQVARLRGGRALAVWQEPGAVKASLRPSAGARFSPAVTVSRHPGAATGAAIRPALAVTPSGEAVVAWLGGPAGGRLGIQVATLPAGASAWSAPVDVAGGTLPQISGVGVSAPLPLAAAADPAGGVAVAWGQPAADPSRRSLDVVAAVRSPAGAWAAPVALGEGGAGLSLTAPAPGDVVAAWHDGACADAATLRAGAVALADGVACRPGALVGRVALSRTASGGAILAVESVPQPVPAGGPSTIQVAARSDAGAWTAPVLAIAGPADLAGAARATRDRTAVAASRGARFNRVRVALVGPDGAVQRRLDGPARPTPPPNTSVRVLPLGPEARVALLLTPERTLRSSRASILTLG
jgi:hypothetical protein